MRNVDIIDDSLIRRINREIGWSKLDPANIPKNLRVLTFYFGEDHHARDKNRMGTVCGIKVYESEENMILITPILKPKSHKSSKPVQTISKIPPKLDKPMLGAEWPSYTVFLEPYLRSCERSRVGQEWDNQEKSFH